MWAAQARPAAPSSRRAAWPAALTAALVADVAPTAIAKTIWEVGKPQGHIEVREDLPTPSEFFSQYVQNEGGPFGKAGKPVLFRGAARGMAAFRLWTEDYLRDKHGNVVLDQVETEKKETRNSLPHENWKMRKFLDEYKSRSLYAVASTPEALGREINLLPFMNCGGMHSKLKETVTWMSSGETRSVIHQDQEQNVHCIFAGQKDWILWHPQEKIRDAKLGWITEETVEGEKGFENVYGQFVGKLDPGNVDLAAFPGWDTLRWWSMTMKAGDCAFVPSAWFHIVEAPAQRSISTHIWFSTPRKFNQKSCDKMEQKGLNTSEYLIRLSDCTFIGAGGEKSEAAGPKVSKCKSKKPAASQGRPGDEL